MPDHVHAVIAFSNPGKTINNIISNRKRFIAYDLISRLQQQDSHLILGELSSSLNNTEIKEGNCTTFSKHLLIGSLPGGRQGMQNRKIYSTKIRLYRFQSMQRQ